MPILASRATPAAAITLPALATTLATLVCAASLSAFAGAAHAQITGSTGGNVVAHAPCRCSEAPTASSAPVR